MVICTVHYLTLQAPTPKNGQKHSIRWQRPKLKSLDRNFNYNVRSTMTKRVKPISCLLVSCWWFDQGFRSTIKNSFHLWSDLVAKINRYVVIVFIIPSAFQSRTKFIVLSNFPKIVTLFLINYFFDVNRTWKNVISKLEEPFSFLLI